MSIVIEQGLRKKFSLFTEAAGCGNAEILQSFARGNESFTLGLEQISSLQTMITLPLTSSDNVATVMELSSSYLPATMWNTMVLKSESAGVADRVRQSLVDAKVRLLPDNNLNRFLKELDMVGVLVPQLSGLLDWISRIDGIQFLGDGDRPVQMDPPSETQVTEPIGANGAMRKLMMQGSFPDDFVYIDGCVRVAVIDSGIDAEHPSLAGRIEQQIEISDVPMPPDPDGHGTHVAGIIAGLSPESRTDLSGIAPFCRLIDIKTYNSLGTTTIALLAAIGCAIKNQVDIINLSMGSSGAPTDGQSLEVIAVGKAIEQGITVCISAGNSGVREDGQGTITLPGDAPDAITVAAVNSDGIRAPFSSVGPTDAPELTGSKPTVAAPGVQIISARSRYCVLSPIDEQGVLLSMDGTSMAAPMISGICALGVAYLKGKGMDKPHPQAVHDALVESGHDYGREGQNMVGAGVPQVPVFLRRLEKKMSAQGKAMSGANMAEEGKGRSDMEMPVVEPTPPSAVPLDVTDVHDSLEPPVRIAREHQALEAAFIQGVKTNLEAYVGDLTYELTGVRKTGLGNFKEDNELYRIEEAVAHHGLAWKVSQALPVNAELSVTINTSGIIKKSRPVLQVHVKSFAGGQAIEKIDRNYCGLDANIVGEYMQRQRQQAGKVPCVFVLLASVGWPEDIKNIALSGGDKEVVLCQPRMGADHNQWFDTIMSNISWSSWLALTPMSFTRRINACRTAMLEHPELKIARGTVRAKEMSDTLQLPEPIGKQLLIESCSQDARFRVLPGADNVEFVERVNMR